MDAVYPFPRVRTQQPSWTNPLTCTVWYFLITGKWFWQAAEPVNFAPAKNHSIIPVKQTLQCTSINHSCHTERYQPKDRSSHCAWHQGTRFLVGGEMAHTLFACAFKPSQNRVLLTPLFCKKVAWCCQSTSQVVILACNDIFYYGCGNLSAGLAREPAAWRNTSACCQTWLYVWAHESAAEEALWKCSVLCIRWCIVGVDTVPYIWILHIFRWGI